MNEVVVVALLQRLTLAGILAVLRCFAWRALGARKLDFLAVRSVCMSGPPWQSDFAAHLARRAGGCRCPA